MTDPHSDGCAVSESDAFKDARDRFEADHREGLHDQAEPAEEFLPAWDRGDDRG